MLKYSSCDVSTLSHALTCNPWSIHITGLSHLSLLSDVFESGIIFSLLSIWYGPQTQTSYKLLYSNIFENICSEIYNADLFPKTLESMHRTIKSGQYSVGKSLTFTGNKSYVFFGLPFVMQELLQTSKPESCFGFCSYQKICTVVFSDGLAQI